MLGWHVLWSRVRSLFRRRQDEDLRAELDGYLAVEADRHQRAGLSAEAARRAALVEAGGLTPVTEAVRAVRVGVAVETTLQDLRYGARVLSRSPGYAAVVALTMALGIGTSASTFGVVHAVLWRPLPYPDPERIVAIEVDARGVRNAGAAPGEARDLRERAHTVVQIAQAVGVDANLNVNGERDRVAAASVTDDLTSLLGLTPLALGRPLEDSRDEGRDAVKSVVISYDLWTRRFKGDPQVIGRHVEVNNLDVEVVGITRPGFRVFLPPDGHLEETVDVWFPTGLGSSRADRYGSLVARLAPGATLATAQAELDTLAAEFVADRTAYPDGQLRFRVRPLQEVMTESSRPALLALGAAVGFVLLIACVNVANVMLARMKSRARELAVRGALGASRLRLLRQLLAENLLLAALGAFLGWILATESLAVIGWLRPPKLPRLGSLAIDPVVLGLAIAATTLVGLLFSQVPAWLAASHGARTPMPTGRGAGLARTRTWQRVLVTAEVALSIVPLVAAGLMTRTVLNLTRAPLGFEPTHVLTASVPLHFAHYPDAGSRVAIYQAAIERVGALPGVEAVSAGSPLPLAPWAYSRRVSTPDQPGRLPVRGSEIVTWPGFLHVMGIRLVGGRDLTADDLAHHRPVALIDQGLARALWPQSPLGRTLLMQASRNTTTLEVVGVTAPLRTARVRDASGPTILVPYPVDLVDLSLVVKTATPASTLGPAIKQAVESLGTGRPVFDIRPLDELVADSIGEERFTLVVLVGFAASALFLAAIGLFGTLSYFISQRMPEFGIRVALGATAGRLVALVASEGARLTGAGLGLGLVGSLAAVGLLERLLYGVAPIDALTLGAVTSGVAVVALAAITRPAWRVAHIDPTITLRGD